MFTYKNYPLILTLKVYIGTYKGSPNTGVDTEIFSIERDRIKSKAIRYPLSISDNNISYPIT